MSPQTTFMQFRLAEGFRNDTGPLTETYKRTRRQLQRKRANQQSKVKKKKAKSKVLSRNKLRAIFCKLVEAF